MAQVKQIRIYAVLSEAVVNLVAIGAADGSDSRSKLRMVASDPAWARQGLGAAKIRCGEEPALLLTLDDKPGSLGRVAERLATAKINIKCTYATTGGGGTAQAVLVVSNPEKAERALA